MSRTDKAFLYTIRFLFASVFIGLCLLCQAGLWLGYVDWDWWLRVVLGR